MGNLLVWLIIYIVLIALLFYFLFKAAKTKNIKYAYPITGVILLMVGMFFL